MQTITLVVPDELAEELSQVRDRLPELLALALKQPAMPAHIYREILAFLVGNPTPEQIAAFGPTPEMQLRLRTLLARQDDGSLTVAEQAELDEFERVEHLMVLVKAGALAHLTPLP